MRVQGDDAVCKRMQKVRHHPLAQQGRSSSPYLMAATTTALRTETFERLLPTLVAVAVVVNDEETTGLQHKQAVALAVSTLFPYHAVYLTCLKPFIPGNRVQR